MLSSIIVVFRGATVPVHLSRYICWVYLLYGRDVVCVTQDLEDKPSAADVRHSFNVFLACIVITL